MMNISEPIQRNKDFSLNFSYPIIMIKFKSKNNPMLVEFAMGKQHLR